MKTIPFAALWKKYRFVLLILLAGVALMLLPSGKTVQKEQPTAATAAFSLEETERRMAELLGQIDGVGRLQLMLTVAGASRLQLAQNVDNSDQRDRRETVTVSRGSGYQEVVVTGESYPVYLGAVIVCQGAGNAAVRLALTEAVSALTGLTADRITIVKWKQS